MQNQHESLSEQINALRRDVESQAKNNDSAINKQQLEDLMEKQQTRIINTAVQRSLSESADVVEGRFTRLEAKLNNVIGNDRDEIISLAQLRNDISNATGQIDNIRAQLDTVTKNQQQFEQRVRARIFFLICSDCLFVLFFPNASFESALMR